MMDPVRNPYAPGAGTRPPELAGRGKILETVEVLLARVRQGRPSKSILMVGLRGVGKTVLLDQLREDAEANGIQTVAVEATGRRSLPAMLAPQLRQALLRLSRNERAKALAQRGLRALAGFAKALKFKYGDIEVGIDFDPEPGLADDGNLELDLQALLEAVGEAAKAAGTALALFVDEMQYIKEKELAALATALHGTARRRFPVALIGAGLPQLRGKMGRAKSYSERLFVFPQVGALDAEDARSAIQRPAAAEGVEIDDDALELIIGRTLGYPYFLQEWGSHAWEAADDSPISKEDVERATVSAIAALDENFFRVRFDQLTPGEKKYMRAMAELGEGPHRSGEIAGVLHRDVTSLGPVRATLIAKGMIWSPNHGLTDFTVPMFEGFMRRSMPEV